MEEMKWQDEDVSVSITTEHVTQRQDPSRTLYVSHLIPSTSL